MTLDEVADSDVAIAYCATRFRVNPLKGTEQKLQARR